MHAARRSVYLDNHSTTALDPRVLEAMMPFLTEDFGNPSSRHSVGNRAQEGIDRARVQVATMLGAKPSEIVFTSGATEANYTALLGACRKKRGHIVVSSIEHSSMLGAAKQLEDDGVSVTYVAPGADGVIDPSAIAAALRPDTLLISVMWVNNEIGTVNPIAEIGALARARGVLFHTDACQGLGRLTLDLSKLPIDLLSLSAHKIYGPKGIGAFFLSERLHTHIAPMMRGGGQEGGLRGGTQNVPGIAGFGRACELVVSEGAAETERLFALRSRLLSALRRIAPDLVVNGSLEHRVAGNLNVSFPNVAGDALMKRLVDQVAVSSGSACAAGAHDTSHVLRAIGREDALARATLRFGLGRFTTEAEIDTATEIIGAALAEVRTVAPPKVTRRSGELTLQSIGAVENDVSEPAYIHWGQVRSRITVDASFADALHELETYSHAVIVSWMHLVKTQKLQHVPQGKLSDVPEVGMFACRCPYRPNPIAVSTVRILAVEENAIVVEGLDLVNGTPVLDIKPYTPEMDAPNGEVRAPGWVSRLTY